MDSVSGCGIKVLEAIERSQDSNLEMLLSEHGPWLRSELVNAC